MGGELSLGTMLALSALASGFLGPVATLVETGTQLQLLGGYVERLDDVLRARASKRWLAVRRIS